MAVYDISNSDVPWRGIAAILPGDLETRYKNLLRAAGALAVFFIVYKINPAALAGLPEPAPTSSFEFKILSKQGERPALNCFTLPLSDVRTTIKNGKLFSTIESFGKSYAGIDFAQTKYLALRTRDETPVSQESEVLSDSNDGLILIEKNLVEKPEDQHIYFTKANTISCK